MKLFKNKKNKALVAAVTMSLVIGVCGSALAADTYYYTHNKGWTTDYNYIKDRNPSSDPSSGLGGYWNSDSGNNHGQADKIYGAYGNEPVHDNGLMVYGGTIDEVYGGYSSVYNVENNSVGLQGGIINKVYAGATDYNLNYIRNNRIDLIGSSDRLTVNELYGGKGHLEENFLAVMCEKQHVKVVEAFSQIQFGFNFNSNKNVILEVDSFRCKPVINTIYSPSSYVLGATATLKADKVEFERLAINFNDAQELSVSSAALPKGVSAKIGYEVLENAISFTTKYDMNADLKIDKNMPLGGTLNLNNHALNMQQTDGQAAKSSTLTVNRLIGTGNLTIDLDLSAVTNDKIVIEGINKNDATINLNSVKVKGELAGEDQRIVEMAVVDGNLDGVNFNFNRNVEMKSIPGYVYVFSKGSAGKIKVIKDENDIVYNFIRGNGKYANLNECNIIRNVTLERVTGKTERTGDNKVLTMNFNSGTSINGNQKTINGIIVDEGYTLKMKGVSSQKATLTQFKGYALQNDGTLELDGIRFTNNEKDIINNTKGTLNLLGNTEIDNIQNDGIINTSTSSNNIQKITGNGTLNVNTNGLIVERSLQQKNVNIKEGTRLDAYRDLNITGTLNNDGYIEVGKYNNKNLGSKDIFINTVTGTGTIEFKGIDAIVENDFVHNNVNVTNRLFHYGRYGSLNLQKNAKITGTLTNEGTVNAKNAEINVLNNKGTTNLEQTNAIKKVDGSGTLNIKAGTTTVEGEFKQKELNFTLSKDIKDGSAMLNLKGATNDISLENSTINTNIDNYTHGTTVTLVRAENSIDLSRTALKIDRAEQKTTTAKTAVDGLSKDVEIAVGYNVSPKEITFTTNSYKLLQDTDVTKDVTLNNELNLNEQTLNMQSDPEGMDPYDTLTVNKLSGNGKLAIDVDLATGKNDKIVIEEANAATITLDSIIVRGDLKGLEATTEHQVDNKVIVIEDKVNDNSLSVANDAIKTSTTDYIYTFTKGAAGKLNVTQEDADTVVDFIQARKKYNDDNILAYTLTKNVKVDEALGETKRDNSRELTVAFNKGVSLSGKTESGELEDGVTVADKFTLKLQGEDEATPGTMTQFKTAATVKENGTLEVADMKFVDNEHDIVNNGTLKLSGTNTVNDIINEGTANLEGNNTVVTLNNSGTANLNGSNTVTTLTNNGVANMQGENTITSVVGAGTFNVEAGETAVNGAFEQTNANVTGGKLALKGNADITSLKVEAAGTMDVDGTLKLANGLENAGVVNMNSDNTLASVAGEGSFNVAEGKKVNVTGVCEQGNVVVAKDAELKVEGKATFTDTLDNAGTVSLNGSEIAALTNTGEAKLKGVNVITTVAGATGILDVEAGTITVNEAFDQSKVAVANASSLILNGKADVTETLKNAGTLSLKGSENTLTSVVGTGTFNVTDGKTTVEKAFVQKTVNVKGGELELKAPKDSFLAGEVQGHAANITGGKVIGHAYSGLSVEDAHENNVTITNGTVDGDVYGGVSYNGNAYKNTVNISGGTVTGDVYGALTINNGTAYKNTVIITGGKIEGNVYGGINEYGTNSTHHDNVINISGGEVGGTIYGASNKVEANNLLHVIAANGKPIEVGNIAYLQKLEFTMPQGYDRSKALLTLTGNEATSLNLNGDESVVLYSSPEERLVTGDRVTLIQKTSDQALELKDNGNVIFNDDGTMKAAYNNIALYKASPLYMLKGKLELNVLDDGKVNDLIFIAGKNAFDRDDEEVKPVPKPEPKPDPQPQPKPEPKPVDPDKPEEPVKPIVPVDPKPEKPVYPDTPDDSDDEPQPQPKPITPVIPDEPDKPDQPVKPEPVDPKPVKPDEPVKPQPIDYDKVYSELMDNVKTAMETRANGAALVNEAGDFLMKQGLSNAKMAAEANKAEGDSSMAPFVALGGGKLRYETGSHVDSKSWHGAVGLAKQVNGLTFGVAIQQGKSNYDAYVNKAHSEGNSKSIGGALFAEKKIANGLHFDAAVRAGRVKNDYSVNVTYSIPGENAFNVRYNESSAFYGISLGGGKEFNLKNKDKVDVYGRYAWTHTGSSEATTNWKDELKFDGINSHRILLGSRYTHAVNERNELYAGLGWQYELGGKVKGSVYGYSAPEPSLKGSSGLLELGWKAAAEENMTVDLNLSGWTGKQRGVMAGVNMQWKF